MAKGFMFEVSASPKSSDYRVVLKDPREIERVAQNLEKDELWGWCEPKLTITFDIFTGDATLDRGSYASEEDFRSSSDYESLEETAISGVQMHITTAARVFQELVEEYYQSKGDKYQDPNYRMIRFDETSS